MVNLLHFPTELQLAIVQCLPQSDLPAVACVHPRLRSLVEDTLYSHIIFTWTKEHPRPPIMRLLRTFLERPELAQQVRWLDLQGHGEKAPDPTGMGRRLHHKFAAFTLSDNPGLSIDVLLKRAVSSGFPPDEAAVWVDEIHGGNSDAVVALIVTMTPHITRISLARNWCACYSFMGKVFRMALCEPRQNSLRDGLPKFEHLASVTLNSRLVYMHNVEAQEQDDILALFYLPRVRELSIPIANRVDMSWPAASPPDPSSLTSLEVSRLRENQLSSVLAVCPNIKVFSYKWLYHVGIDKPLNQEVMDVDQIAEALVAHCRDTLTDFKLEVTSMVSWPPVLLSGSLAAISQLHQLKRMNLPSPLVLGAMENPTPERIGSFAPAGLEYLGLQSALMDQDEYDWFPEDIVAAVRRGLDMGLQTSLASLKGIRVDVPSLGLYMDMEDGAAEIERLRAHFRVRLDVPDEIYLEVIRPNSP